MYCTYQSISPSGRPAGSVSDRITESFQTLTESAENINGISNELAKPVASLERADGRRDPAEREELDHPQTDRRQGGASPR